MIVNFISSWDSFHAAVAEMQKAELLALDAETTGLCPLKNTIRLLTISDGANTWIVDTSVFSPVPLFNALQGKTLVLHNAIFDLRFLARLGFWPGKVFDTLLLSQIVYAGLREENNKPISHSLGEVAKRELSIDLPKELQKSDWNGRLTQEQIDYAARDAAVLIPIYKSLIGKAEHFKLMTVVDIEHRCLPAILWMSYQGIPFNAEKWLAVATKEMARADGLEKELDFLAQVEGVEGKVNFNSWQQVLKVFAAAGINLPNTAFETLSFVDHPIARKLVERREAVKRYGSYGRNWLDHLHNGRIYTNWRQIGAVSGRMSSNDPAVQTVPHLEGEPYRSCIEAPAGYKLIIADLSQIELRIAAKIANETKMTEAFNKGLDLHTLTAQQVLGISEVTKQDRQLAKAVNFGLVYGMGAPKFKRYARLQYGVEMTEEEAKGYTDRYAKAYPAIKKWHRSMGDSPVTTRTLAGRWRIGVESYSEKLNSPVQGTGADMLKLALALLYEYRECIPGSYPIIACHDELVVCAPEDDAERVAAWVKKCLMDGGAWMIHPVPMGVEVKIGDTWASK